MTWKQASRFLSVALSIALIVLAGRFLDRPVALPGKPSAEILRREFSSLPVPADHKPIDLLRIVDRRTIVAGRTFESASTPKDVVAYYLAALPALGWKLHSQRLVPVSEPQVLFCKSRLSLAVSFIAQQDNSSHYYLGVTWTDSTNSDDYCGGPN